MSRRCGTRIGAATFVLGLSLAGPQALGVAAADTGDTDSAAVSAGAPRAAAAHAGRSGRAAPRTAASHAGVAARQVASAAAAEEASGSEDSSGAQIPVVTIELPADEPIIDPVVITDPVVDPVEEPVDDSVVVDPVEEPVTDPVEEPVDDSVVVDPVKDPGGDSEVIVDPVDLPRWDWNWEDGQPLPWWRDTTEDGGDVLYAYDTVDTPCPTCSPVPVAGAGTQGASATSSDVQASFGRLNTAIAGFFDSVSRLLSSVPANPISELLSGALLLVRRTLFNQLPSADPARYLETATGELEGNLNATDPEGDELSYRVVEAPQFGTVTIDANGVFRYAPDQSLQATYPAGCPVGPGGCMPPTVLMAQDSFTVAVSDTGFNLLDPFSDRVYEVTVRVPNAELEGTVGSTKGFDVYNLTSQTLKYVSSHGTYAISPWEFDEPDTAPPIGWELKPGESAHFEVTFYAFTDTYTAPEFAATDGSYGSWSALLLLDAFYTRNAECNSSKNTCSVSSDGTKVYFLDPPGTVIDIPAGQGQRQADTLRLLCNDRSSNMTCEFIPLQDGFKQTLTDQKPVGPPLKNNTTSDATLTLTRSETVETTSSVSLTGSAKVSILKVFEAGVERNTTQSLTTSKEWTYSIGIVARPGESAVLLAQDPIKRVTGDFKGKIGNTSWILRGVSFDTPDPDKNRPWLPESGLPSPQSDGGQPIYTASAFTSP